MGNGLIVLHRASEPLQKIVRQLRVLAVAADHIAGAGRLGCTPHDGAIHRHTWYEATELLPLDCTLCIDVAIAHDGRERHDRKRLPAGPGSINLWRAPALNVRWHVLDDGGEGLYGPDTLRGVDAWLHLLIEQEPTEVGWEVLMREVKTAIPQGAIEILGKCLPPARLVFLGVEKRRQLLPLRHGLRTSRLPAICGLKGFFDAWQFQEVSA